jgi:hypothetical protein
MSAGDGPSLSKIISDEQRMQEFSLLTPLQQMILEVLASRYRLGHEVWTFTNSRNQLARQFKALRERGYIETMPGVVSYTIRAMLTTKGKDLVLDPTYVPPILGGDDNVKEKHDPHAT